MCHGRLKIKNEVSLSDDHFLPERLSIYERLKEESNDSLLKSMSLSHVVVALAAYSIILTAQGQTAASEGRCASYTIKLDTNRLG